VSYAATGRIDARDTIALEIAAPLHLGEARWRGETGRVRLDKDRWRRATGGVGSVLLLTSSCLALFAWRQARGSPAVDPLSAVATGVVVFVAWGVLPDAWAIARVPLEAPVVSLAADCAGPAPPGECRIWDVERRGDESIVVASAECGWPRAWRSVPGGCVSRGASGERIVELGSPSGPGAE
jgi:hypothetical protein